MQDHGDDDYGDGDDGGVVCTCVNRCRRKYHLLSLLLAPRRPPVLELNFH